MIILMTNAFSDRAGVVAMILTKRIEQTPGPEFSDDHLHRRRQKVVKTGTSTLNRLEFDSIAYFPPVRMDSKQLFESRSAACYGFLVARCRPDD